MLFNCNKCDTSFKFKRSLKSHIEKIHKITSLSDDSSIGSMKEHECNQCGKKLTKKSNLIVHIDTVHKKKDFVCFKKECKYTTKSVFFMKKHRKTEHGGMMKQRKFGKIMSKQSQNYKKSLKRALKVTQNKIKKEAVEQEGNKDLDNNESKTEEKTSNIFDCTYCNKKFVGKDNFKRHVNGMHLGVKYDCNQCSYKATQISNLNEHIKAVHDHMRYQCDYCEYNSQRRKVVLEHCISSHNINLKPSDINRKKILPSSSTVISPKIAKTVNSKKVINLSEFYCDFCPFETDENENALNNHLVSKHFDEVSGY